MYAKFLSFGLRGLSSFQVTVEASRANGLPCFSVVGLPDSAVKESGDRVKAALQSLGYAWPSSRITVNLAPADVRKSGPIYDLPIFLSVMAVSKQCPLPGADCAFLGELALDGTLRPVSGVLPMVSAAAEMGITKLYLPAENAAEAASVSDGVLSVYPCTDARQVVMALSGKAEIQPFAAEPFTPELSADSFADFADVHGQLLARRALEIAAAGGHNVLLMGAPGTGKSMLAKRLPGILPPMSKAESIETTKIYSVAGLLPSNSGLIRLRPFRSPHHTTSAAALAGGGSAYKPGEVSLSNRGVLFLDELPEFSREALEVLRQPVEDGYVTVSRVSGSATYPSHFQLIAAMNPCPCGNLGHPTKRCTCTLSAIERYRGRISGPLLDRIDLHVEMEPITYDELQGNAGGESSAEIRARVLHAREIQQKRYASPVYAGVICNADLSGSQIRRVCRLTRGAEQALRSAYKELSLSARGYDRILRVARTIADLAGTDEIGEDAVYEALQYRAMDRTATYSM